MIRYVLGFAFNPDITQVVLIEKVKPDWQKGFLNGVGGKIEGKELPSTAMEREFIEETGCLQLRQAWMQVAHIQRSQDFTCHVFMTILTMAQWARVHTREIEKVECFPLEHVYKYRNRLLPNLPGLIGMCLDPQRPQVLMEYE